MIPPNQNNCNAIFDYFNIVFGEQLEAEGKQTRRSWQNKTQLRSWRPLELSCYFGSWRPLECLDRLLHLGTSWLSISFTYFQKYGSQVLVCLPVYLLSQSLRDVGNNTSFLLCWIIFILFCVGNSYEAEPLKRWLEPTHKMQWKTLLHFIWDKFYRFVSGCQLWIQRILKLTALAEV